MVQLSKSVHVTRHISKIKNKYDMIISIYAKKAFDKIQLPSTIKPLKKLGIGGTYNNIIKPIYDKPRANTILDGEKLKVFPPRSGTRKGCLPSHHFYST